MLTALPGFNSACARPRAGRRRETARSGAVTNRHGDAGGERKQSVDILQRHGALHRANQPRQNFHRGLLSATAGISDIDAAVAPAASIGAENKHVPCLAGLNRYGQRRGIRAATYEETLTGASGFRSGGQLRQAVACRSTRKPVP